MMTIFRLALISAVSFTGSAYAIDIGKAALRSIDAQLTSARPPYDLERCIIELDTRDAPSVYRQPDRPTDVTIVYSGAGVIYGLVKLHTGGGNTSVTLHSLKGLSGAKIKHGVEGCAA